MRNGISKDLITRILGAAPKYTLDKLEEKYPARNLSVDTFVTRFAPSPTGFMHLGGLYQMLINHKLAQQSGGVFILRIEDTDTKREIDGAVDLILDTAKEFNLMPDEGKYLNHEFKLDNYDDVVEVRGDGSIFDESENKYGPFYQSMRKDIYHSVVADLLARGLAYPCFLTADDMEKIRSEQSSLKISTGIYGNYAKYRDLTEEQILDKLTELGDDFKPTIRLYSNGNSDMRIFCKDAARGSIAFPENNEDTVLIKSDNGLPTYHFAHLCDDHFMRVTHVVRGEEWLPSFPLHIQLFNMMQWSVPKYIHTSTIDKIDEQTGKQRKLSKRKDPEANIEYFLKQGWPTDAVLEYLFNIVSSNFEEDKLKGKVKNIWDAELRVKKIPMSGALFDIKKLEWWSKEFIATLSVSDLVKSVTDWANKYGDENNQLQVADADYLRSILAIERDNPKRIRKDFINWRQTLEEITYFWDNLFVQNTEFEYTQNALDAFCTGFDINDDQNVWWDKIVKIAADLDMKPGDVAMNLRVALSGRTNAPDLYSVIKVMGTDRVINRIKKVTG